MKKIFAIALAVVMVLSMASAFALSQCATWNPSWECGVDDIWCGQGKVEVVPYVKVNTACGWEYQVSDCASAIRSTEVYWAIKLTVDAYPDAGWWEEAVLDLETEGLALNWDYEDNFHQYNFGEVVSIDHTVGLIDADFDGIVYDAGTEEVYYLSNTSNNVSTANNSWIAADDATFANGSNVVFEAEVLNANVCNETDYDVCATLRSEYDGYSLDLYRPYNEVEDYFFEFGGFTYDKKGLINGNDDDPDFNKKGEMTGWFEVYNEDGDYVYIAVEEGKAWDLEWNDASFKDEVLADFGLTNCASAACFTKDNIKANFGWDDEQEHCFSWSTKGASVVDTDCVVAIPKTGDASVLAWLF